jgi:hypothetical protein
MIAERYVVLIRLIMSKTSSNPVKKISDYKEEVLINKLLRVSRDLIFVSHKIKSPLSEYRGFDFNWHGYMKICNREIEVHPKNINDPVFYLLDHEEIEEFFKEEFSEYKFLWNKK